MPVYESLDPRGGGVTVAGALLLVITIVGLFSRPLLAIDETRYAAVALEMLQRGDWLVPHLNGETYSHKPPALFWLILLGWKVFGVSVVWARLVGPLAGVASLGLIVVLARALWPADVRVRRWAPLITVGALAWGAFGSLLMFDTLLTCASLIAATGVVWAVERQRTQLGVGLLAVGIAFGILAKGPVILIHVLPVAVSAPWWATPREDRVWSDWYRSLLLGTVVGVLAALVWAVPAGIAGGERYRDEIFMGQTAGRMVKSFAHRRPIWWYLPLLPVVLFPWFAWPEAWRALRGLRMAPRDSGVRFCLVWAGAGLLAFSLVSGKQLHYLVPLIPALALVLARGLSRREAAQLSQPWIAGLVIALSGLAIVVAGTTRLADQVLWWPHPPIAVGWTALIFGAAILLMVWQRARITRNAAVHALAFSTVLTICGIQLAAVGAVSVPYDTAPMAAAVNEALIRGHPVAMVGTYNGEYHFAPRLRGVHIEELADSQAAGWLRTHNGGLLLRYDRGREPPMLAGTVARHPFRNGWATLSPSLRRSGGVLPAVSADD